MGACGLVLRVVVHAEAVEEDVAQKLLNLEWEGEGRKKEKSQVLKEGGELLARCCCCKQERESDPRQKVNEEGGGWESE
jgi:hypothetical protein